jgi:putative endonuclease
MEWPRFKKKSSATNSGTNTKALGDAAEDAALAHLLAAGMRLVARNFRTPGRGGGEIDLIMRERDGTLVFVEVRRRTSASHGGAAASVGTVKQRRIVFAARHYLMRVSPLPPCRFDVVVVQGDANGHQALPTLDWIRAAFDAGDG